jgi:hypothetical protein
MIHPSLVSSTSNPILSLTAAKARHPTSQKSISSQGQIPGYTIVGILAGVLFGNPPIMMDGAISLFPITKARRLL